ncbi:2183_t:CDS:1 [Diversispora eburnea]|uniref:2183_t:CDS:1 n=1 Tax=Diversispora eburnea TaxID=1213867 RepID=A0A9N9A544_9GLOM|nr:2183_t:CDS:1 [Diversispora eburnea]
MKFIKDQFLLLRYHMINHKTRKTVCKMLCPGTLPFLKCLISEDKELGVHIIIQKKPISPKHVVGVKMFKYWWNCKAVMDQDENGAQGIFLQALLNGALILSDDHARNSSHT